MSKEFWNERYTINESVYGSMPNNFFRDQLNRLNPGKLLLPAEGEGRNAVYAAKQDWLVEAFDYSAVAKEKALQRASSHQVTIKYWTDDIESITLPKATYDAIALIYVHLNPIFRNRFHQQCVAALKKGGTLILEAFSKAQLNYASGGPKDASMLYACNDLALDFSGLLLAQNKQEVIELEEGSFHKGKASVIRLIGRKM